MSKIKSSKLTQKYQTTVPTEIRKILNLHKGDSVAFEIQDDNVVLLRKATRADLEWPSALEGTLSEWNSANDEEAYRDL